MLVEQLVLSALAAWGACGEKVGGEIKHLPKPQVVQLLGQRRHSVERIAFRRFVTFEGEPARFWKVIAAEPTGPAFYQEKSGSYWYLAELDTRIYAVNFALGRRAVITDVSRASESTQKVYERLCLRLSCGGGTFVIPAIQGIKTLVIDSRVATSLPTSPLSVVRALRGELTTHPFVDRTLVQEDHIWVVAYLPNGAALKLAMARTQSGGRPAWLLVRAIKS